MKESTKITVTPDSGGGNGCLGFIILVALLAALFFYIKGCGGGSPDGEAGGDAPANVAVEEENESVEDEAGGVEEIPVITIKVDETGTYEVNGEKYDDAETAVNAAPENAVITIDDDNASDDAMEKLNNAINAK